MARFGLKHLGNKPSIGLRALLKESGLEVGSSPEIEDVTFKLAPRINACGRLNDPEVASSLMLETDPIICRQLAQKMNGYNEDRKGSKPNSPSMLLNKPIKAFRIKPAVVVCGMGEAWNPGWLELWLEKCPASWENLALCWLNRTTEPAKDRTRRPRP